MIWNPDLQKLQLLEIETAADRDRPISGSSNRSYNESVSIDEYFDFFKPEHSSKNNLN